MEKLLGAFIFLKARWREPSTQAALSGLCLNFGLQFPGETIGQLFTVASIAFGVLGFWFKEGKPETKID